MTNFLWLVIIKIALKPSLVSSQALQLVGEARLLARRSLATYRAVHGRLSAAGMEGSCNSSQDVI